MSWRLGGKTASGRGEYDRIEEHGLHVLFGAYHNAFDLMLDCYDRLAEDKAAAGQHAHRHFFDAVEPRHFGVIGEDDVPVDVAWLPWYLQFPCNSRAPGDRPLPTVRDLPLTLVQLMVHVDARGVRAAQVPGLRFAGWSGTSASCRASRRCGCPATTPPSRCRSPSTRARGSRGWRSGWCARVMDEATWPGRLFRWIIWNLHDAAQATPRPHGQAWTVLDFSFATLKGMIAHGFLVSDKRKRTDPRGQDPGSGWGYYDRIDQFDFRHWLAIYDADPATLESPFVRIVYDAAFSYEDGGLEVDKDARMLNESMGAGTVLRIMMLMGFTYKHAMYFKMRGGMGDIISAPLYEVLKRRGVKFQFFHRVRALRPGKDGAGARRDHRGGDRQAGSAEARSRVPAGALAPGPADLAVAAAPRGHRSRLVPGCLRGREELPAARAAARRTVHADRVRQADLRHPGRLHPLRLPGPGGRRRSQQARPSIPSGQQFFRTQTWARCRPWRCRSGSGRRCKAWAGRSRRRCSACSSIR